ncbi:MAG: hypothetical protein HOQ22_05700 [Nocardioidaceae bacterium]|nr:hypothetical protein [Nocardioidaceae bacterium]NUS50521.1 hypothetical protein [Nocardioidaceae bacterium]
MTTAPYRPTIRTQADLPAMWRTLMTPLGFARRRLYLTFVLGDGCAVPHLTELDDLPEQPGDLAVDNLMAMCAALLENSLTEGSRPVLLLARPGAARLTDSDRAWGTALLAAAEAHRVPLWPVHVAGDDDVVVLAPGDLAA